MQNDSKYYRVYLPDSTNPSGMSSMLLRGSPVLLEDTFNALHLVYTEETVVDMRHIVEGTEKMLMKDVGNLLDLEYHKEMSHNNVMEMFLAIIDGEKDK